MPVPSTPVPTGLVPLTTGAESLLRAHAPSLFDIDLPLQAVAAVQFHRLRAAPLHDDSVPLFLRNASILC